MSDKKQMDCYYACGGEIGEANRKAATISFVPAPGSPAPIWYTSDELYHYLRIQNYAQNIAEELSVKYAENLQKAFAKGWSMGERKAKQENSD